MSACANGGRPSIVGNWKDGKLIIIPVCEGGMNAEFVAGIEVSGLQLDGLMTSCGDKELAADESGVPVDFCCSKILCCCCWVVWMTDELLWVSLSFNIIMAFSAFLLHFSNASVNSISDFDGKILRSVSKGVIGWSFSMVEDGGFFRFVAPGEFRFSWTSKPKQKYYSFFSQFYPALPFFYELNKSRFWQLKIWNQSACEFDKYQLKVISRSQNNCFSSVQKGSSGVESPPPPPPLPLSSTSPGAMQKCPISDRLSLAGDT